MKDQPEITPFLEAVIHNCKESLGNTLKNMNPFIAINLRSAPEGVAFMQLGIGAMDNTASKQALAATIRQIRAEKKRDLEAMAFCVDGWAHKEGTPKEYLNLLRDNIIKISDLPARWQQDVIVVRYYYTPEFAQASSWLGNFPYTINGDSGLSWGAPTWVQHTYDNRIEGIFGD